MVWPAEAYINEQFASIRVIRELLKNPKELQKAVEGLVAENAEVRRKLEKAEARQLSELRSQLLQKVQSVNGVSFIGEIVEAGSADALKKLCFDLKTDLSSGGNGSTPATAVGGTAYLVVLAANIEGKAAVAVLIDEQLAGSKGIQAPAIIKEHIAPLIKGGGGGQKTLATAGGQEAGNLPQVIERVKNSLR